MFKIIMTAMLVAFSTMVFAADGVLPLPTMPDITLPDGWTLAVGASTEMRWRGLKLSEDIFVGAGVTYTTEEHDTFIFDTARFFGSATVAKVKVPEVELGLVDDIDIYGRVAVGVTGKVYDGMGNYTISYVHSRFDGVEQDDYIFGLSGYVVDGVKLGGNIGYTDDVFGMFGSATFGDVFVGIDTWYDTHTTFKYGMQEDSNVDGYDYWEVSLDKSFGEHVTATVAYTDVSDGTNYPSAFTDDSIRLDVTYKF